MDVVDRGAPVLASLFGAREAESPILGGTDFLKPGKVQQTGCSDLSRPTKMSSNDFLKKKDFLTLMES